MKSRTYLLVTTAAVLAAMLVTWLAAGGAQAEEPQFRAKLVGYEEVPAVSTAARGALSARVASGGTAINYVLSYTGLEGTATGAHIHFGQRAVDGGIIAFLCGGGGKPACPVTSGEITGTITAADVSGPADQGIGAGQLAEAIKAMRAGLVYANVHSTLFSDGEIRGQVRKGNTGKGKKK